MNIIKFRVIRTSHWYGRGIQFIIDGRDFLDCVKSFESAFVPPKFAEGRAGDYSGLSADTYLPPSRHFWGEEGKEWWGGKSELYTCGGCGEVGCWPLVAKIITTDKSVTWADFEQPHYNEEELGERGWRYEGLGPFEFDRAQYEAALAAIK